MNQMIEPRNAEPNRQSVGKDSHPKKMGQGRKGITIKLKPKYKMLIITKAVLADLLMIHPPSVLAQMLIVSILL